MSGNKDVQQVEFIRHIVFRKVEFLMFNTEYYSTTHFARNHSFYNVLIYMTLTIYQRK